MAAGRPTGAASLLLVGLLCRGVAAGQDPALPEEAGEGFRLFIRMAQNGRLGADVINANVGVERSRARVELVRTGAPSKVLVLTQKVSPDAPSRYFDIEPGEHATARDAALVGAALDECFAADPFQLQVYEASPGGGPLPGLEEAWAYGGWRAVLLGLERRMMVLASLEYTVGLIAVLALGLLASLALLWWSLPPGAADGSSRVAR